LVTIGETLAVTGVVTANAGVVVDNIIIDGSTITSNTHLNLDIAGDLRIDVDGAEVKLADGGTEFGILYKSGNNLAIFSSVSDGDLLLQGNDGGATITALTLDMSAAGAATFNGVVTANAGVVVDEMTLDADTLTATDDFILDVVGDIDLNTDSGLITLKDASVHFGSLYNSGSNLHVASTTQDKDILLQGMDGNTTLFTMLQLDASDAGAARFGNGTAALPSISNLGDTNTGIFFPAADTIAFAEGGNEIFKLDSSGNVGIKKDDTAIDTRLHIDNCPDNKVITFEQSGRKMAMGTFFSSGSTASRLDFFLSDGNQNGGNNNRMSISASGDAKLITGNLVIGTAGKGIDFSASGGPQGSGNELLDDYEEGTWTPVVAGSSTAGSVSFSTRTAFYTKIGRFVHIDCVLDYTISGEAGDLQISGLPFQTASEAVGSFQCNNMELAYQSNVGQYTPRTADNVTAFTFRGTVTNGGDFASMAAQSMSFLRVAIQYQTD